MSGVSGDQAPTQVIELLDRRQLRWVGFKAALSDASQIDVAKACLGGICRARRGRLRRRLVAVCALRGCLVHVAHSEVRSSDPAGLESDRAPEGWRAHRRFSRANRE